MDNMYPELQNFVESLVKEKDFSDLDPGIVDQIKQDLASRVEDHINAEILANMPEGKISEFNSLLDTNDMEKVQQFVMANIPNLDEVITNTLIEFRKTYLGL